MLTGVGRVAEAENSGDESLAAACARVAADGIRVVLPADPAGSLPATDDTGSLALTDTGGDAGEDAVDSVAAVPPRERERARVGVDAEAASGGSIN